FEKPGQGLMSTRAPIWAARSRVLSVDSESINRISSAQATDSQAARMLSASLSVMIVAVIFIVAQIDNLRARKLTTCATKCQKPDREGGANFAKAALPDGRASDTSFRLTQSYGFGTGLCITTLLM